MAVTVTTTDELKNAIQAEAQEIRVVGDLANALIAHKKKRKIAKISLGVGLVALALAPFTGGTSVAGFTAVAGSSAATVTAGHILAFTALTAVTFGGVALLKVIDKGYDIVEVSHGETRLRAKKRKA